MKDLEFSTLQNQLTKRFEPENICFEHFYIKRMNPKLQISISTFQNDPKIKSRKISNQQLRNALNSIQYLQKVRGCLKQQKFRINYQNSKTIVLITGIKIEFVEILLNQFEKQYQKYGKIKQTNQFWVSIEMSSPQSARAFKKLARSQKRICDISEYNKYKIEKKRVRIVIQDEDFYTILVDAMSQQKAVKFHESFGKQSVDKVWYQKIEFNRGETGENGNPRQQQQAFDDNYSEEQSRTTEGLDARSLNDCIQTTDQGIQAEKIDEYMNLQCPKSPRSKQDIKIIYSTSYQKTELQKYETQTLEQNQQKTKQTQINTCKSRSDQYLKHSPNKLQSLIPQMSVINSLDQLVEKIDNNILKQYDSCRIQTKIQKKHLLSQQKEQIKQLQSSIIINEQKKQYTPINRVQNSQKSVKKQVSVLLDNKSLMLNKIALERQFRYEYLHMKKLFHQLQKQRKQTKHVDIHIPSYLVKQCQHERYHRYFLDGIWRSGRYGSKRNCLKNQAI